MFTSIAQAAKALAAPALSRALFDLAAYARVGANVLDDAAMRLHRVAREAAAPVPAHHHPVHQDADPGYLAFNLSDPEGLAGLVQLAHDQGRVTYAP